MKKIFLTTFILLSQFAIPQVGIGTAAIYGDVGILDTDQINHIVKKGHLDNQITFSIKGLANVTPDYYKVIFEISQIGETVESVNRKLQIRIDSILNKTNKLNSISHHLDMISMVPRYNLNSEKKIFSKVTFNEVPEGFEIKKNIHFKFKNPNDIHKIVNYLAQSEVYNIIKISAHSNKISETKSELIKEVKACLETKLIDYKFFSGEDLNTYTRQIADGFKVVYPIDNYKTYQASSNANLNREYSSYKVEHIQKSKTSFFNSISPKTFDIVLNPDFIIPPIQVMYQIDLNLHKKQKPITQTKFKYFVIGQNGETKQIQISEN